MTDLRQALTPLADRMVREHQVLHVLGELPETGDPIGSARSEILKWAQQKNGGRFPDDAVIGAEFEVPTPGRSSAVVNVDLPEIQAWALRQEDPDKTVAGRTWTCDATLWRTPDRQPKLAVRLIVGSREAHLPITVATPGFVRRIADVIGLLCDGRQLSSQPDYVDAGAASDALGDLLVDEYRALPVVVFSMGAPPDLAAVAAARRAAVQLCGLAHFFTLTPAASWALTGRFGRRLSVFGQAVRIYMPGFNDEADPYAHRLWLGARFVTPNDVEAALGSIGALVAGSSTSVLRIGKDILPFAQLRSASREVALARLTEGGATDTVKLRAATARITALEKERDDAKELEHMALLAEAEAQQRAKEAESRERKAIAKVQVMLGQLQGTTGISESDMSLPDKWKDFGAWCDSALVGRVALTGPAQQGCRKARFKDVSLAARCLLWLAGECRQLFLTGGAPVGEAPVESGVRNAHCGSDVFEFDWRGTRRVAEWHVKNGNARQPEYCLRIYYAWDDQMQQIIVADMPAHRRTDAS